ncbi:NADHubiquinone oxidoreductase subunit A11 [Cricetulus griseus]
MSSAALPSSQSWAPGSAPTPALAALHKPWCEVRGKGWRSGKADQRGSRVVVGGMEPARCGDTSGPSHRHVEGAIGSAYSVVLNPADSHVEAMARAGRYTFTAAAIGAMFGLATCVSAQVREKPDDPLNYFIGGCAAGLTLGARTHSYGTAAVGCVYMGTAATLFKIGKLEGWDLFATPRV